MVTRSIRALAGALLAAGVVFPAGAQGPWSDPGDAPLEGEALDEAPLEGEAFDDTPLEPGEIGAGEYGEVERPDPEFPDPEPETEPVGLGDAGLVHALPVSFDDRRLDQCAESPEPVLNEVCAVGTECDEDVRVGDFVEVYNPAASPVDLGCFVLVGREDVPFVPQGSLEPGGVRAWGEGELRFRIRKGGDAVRLLRVKRGIDDAPELLPLESVVIDGERAHLYRSPDGGAWLQQGTVDAEYDRPGTFGESNTMAEPG